MSSFQIYDNIESLPGIIYSEKSKRVFLVTGKSSFESSGAKLVLEKYLANIDHYRFSDYSTNPKYEDILKGRKLIAQFKPDLIIAIGGGSSLDIAKIIAALPVEPVMAKKAITGEISIKPRKIKFIAIPTTAGSGSECTHFAVAYIENIKYSVANPKFIPDYVILDHRLTYSMSPDLTAIVGMDALSQAIESFWAVNATTESIEYAKESLENILGAFPEVVVDPTPALRKKMMLGSHFAGKAINISKTTSSHALSYAMTTNYNIPHGYAVFLTLPSFYNINTNASKENLNQNLSYKEYRKRIDELKSVFKRKYINNVCEYLNSIITNSGFSLQLRNLGIRKEDLVEIGCSVNKERLSNNPVSVDNEEIISLLNRIW